ncbi:MAG: hypothetical protein K8R58_05110 [Bacteroidales bacterium]|nr:hypothetical protein [Bacteroidales bacterium]
MKKKIIIAGLIVIVMVGFVAVFIAGCVNNPANTTTARDDVSVWIERTWSTDSLGYYVGWSDSDLSHQEEYKAGEGWKFIILDMHVYNTANESRVFKYPHIVNDAGIEYYPIVLEGDSHFSYYQDDEYLRKKYGFGYWGMESFLLGKSSLLLTSKSIYITIVYKIPINERPAKFYYQICESDGIVLSIGYKDI